MDQVKINIVKCSSQDLHHSNCDPTFNYTNVNVLNYPIKMFVCPATFAENPQAKNLGFMLDFCHFCFFLAVKVFQSAASFQQFRWCPQ